MVKDWKLTLYYGQILHVFGCYSKVNLLLTLNYLQSLIYGPRRIFRHPTWWGSEKNFVADFCTIAVNLRTRARCSLDTWEFFEKHILLNIPKPTRIQMSNLKFGLFVKMDQSNIHPCKEVYSRIGHVILSLFPKEGLTFPLYNFNPPQKVTKYQQINRISYHVSNQLFIK